MVKAVPGKEKYFVERSERDLKNAIKDENTTEYLRDNGIETQSHKTTKGIAGGMFAAATVGLIAAGVVAATAGTGGVALPPIVIALAATMMAGSAAVGISAHNAEKRDSEKVDRTIAKHANLIDRVESQEEAKAKFTSLKHGKNSAEHNNVNSKNQDALLERQSNFNDELDKSYNSPDISEGANLAAKVSASRGGGGKGR